MGDNELEMTVYNAVAHVFEIDRALQRWVLKGESTIPIAFVVSRRRDDSSPDQASGDKVLKLVAAENGNIVLESVITPNMSFVRRSDKFGQWEDQIANTFYGLGFNSEAEIEDFCKTFKDLQSELVIDESIKSILSQQAVSRPLPASSNTGINLSQSHHNFNQTSSSTNNNGGSVITEDFKKQLESENKRLKLQLEETAKCWQKENNILTNNNHKLTQALEDSKVNVSAWEKELSSLRKENTELKLKLSNFETNNNSKRSNEQEKELEEYKLKLERLQTQLQADLQSKNDMIENLQTSLNDLKLEKDETQKDNNETQFREDFKTILSDLDARLGAQLSEFAKIKSNLTDVVNQL